ncbi:MAG: hypothetical protein EOO38_08840 [Cytophagaceae bacterium]|nr:MAG: hypothetical protein EOO38_08840 [Cytophagaceae bacterium]
MSIRETHLFSGVASSTWLGGPGVLQLQAKIIPLQNVILTNDCAQLGPGPDRRGYLTTDSRDLPRLELKHYLTAHALRGQRITNNRRVIREDRLPLCGWISLDDRHTAPMETSTDQSQRLEGHSFAVLGIYRAQSGGLAYLGIYLKTIQDSEQDVPQYRRIGCGQMSHSFISGEDLNFWSARQDEIGWSTKTDTGPLQIPQELFQTSTIDIC